MSSDQTYYLTIALINLVLAFAGTRIKNTDESTKSTQFLFGSFYVFAISWFLYSLELTLFIEILSAILSSMFIWGITIFSFKRCKIATPSKLIACLFLLNITMQSYFILNGNISGLLHTSSLFIPIAFSLCAYLFLKKKVDRNPSDMIIVYTYIVMIIIVISRSILLEISPETFGITMASTQVIWPIFSVISGIFFLLSFTEEAQKKLIAESTTDTLTGLFNRRMFDEKFKQLLPSLSHGKHYGALLYIDLDGFKPINDKYGHNIGDKVLVEFGIRLNHSLRDEEVIARIGGDEFAILIKNTGQNKTSAYQCAYALAQRVQRLMKEDIDINGFKLQIDCSIGVHILTPQATDAELEIKAADAAMYQAKKRLHNSIVFSENLSPYKYNLAKIGITETGSDRQEIDNLLFSLLDKQIDIASGFPQLIQMVSSYFKDEVAVSKKMQSNLSTEQRIDHIELLDSLQKINIRNNDYTMLKNLLSFIKQLEMHNQKYKHDEGIKA
ncbi:GGDEF domain-containing protein [Psychromonas sp. SP041]|uniref:GGDEF domain-containing protein n=1 Tax=Psychromonas sp. SP041 TaxID=1365007 RepID=UPI00046ED8B1|nr:GGDEF domain-containing protein [Psychromonas sp. SP041]